MNEKINRRQFLKALVMVGGAAAIFSGKLKGSFLNGAAQAFSKDLFLPYLSGDQRIVGPGTPDPQITRTPIPTNQTPAPASFKNVIFLHHSVGEQLMTYGNVRALFSEKGYEFWDHNYNNPGLTGPDGISTGYNYDIPGDNTDPSGLGAIFEQPSYTTPSHPQPPQNAFSGLMRHEVIIFKSCYTASSIDQDKDLEDYKKIYINIRNRIDQYPDRLFIAFSPPPRNPLETSPDAAGRARAFANWLKSSEYTNGHGNLFVFDFFDLLAESDPGKADYNMLQAGYREGGDSHPTAIAHQTIAPIFRDFVHNAVISFQKSHL